MNKAEERRETSIDLEFLSSSCIPEVQRDAKNGIGESTQITEQPRERGRKGGREKERERERANDRQKDRQTEKRMAHL